ncbi:hypothetical protein WOLCODRAFT_142076 [Wolfiporia cocos MD-104 SS10]|uniref:Uncharacterized protein n=1 Tax=Wolfiporia cocos (strain MD-104) TaxID=742152 RepID=A0A2H3IWG8_WOLCO|nr:hypothetical protein WOLCODRAFT_142076 [Wolfiporia cocos MD-104 SS10]
MSMMLRVTLKKTRRFVKSAKWASRNKSSYNCGTVRRDGAYRHNSASSTHYYGAPRPSRPIQLAETDLHLFDHVHAGGIRYPYSPTHSRNTLSGPSSDADVTPRRRLRRTKRIVSCPSNTSRYPDSPPYSVARGPRRHSLPAQFLSMQVKDPVSSDTDSSSSGSSLYITARSRFTDSDEEEGFRSILQVLGEDSGMIFDKVCQGPHGETLAKPTKAAYLDEHSNTSNQVFHMAPLRMEAASSNVVPQSAIPSLVLTVPTPQLPPSPIFVPQSPITLHKFVAASSQPAPSTAARSGPIPAIPLCAACCLLLSPASEHPADPCADCAPQWLACKVWYQAHDGGRRARLTEPYVKPAESTAATRALADLLGVGGAGGLGIHAGAPGPVLSKSRFRRLAPLLALAAAESSASVASAGRVVVRRADVRAVVRRLCGLWAKTVLGARVKLGAAGLLRTSAAKREDIPSSSSGSGSLATSATQESSVSSQHLPGRSGMLAITSMSRFHEHIPDSISIP